MVHGTLGYVLSYVAIAFSLVIGGFLVPLVPRAAALVVRLGRRWHFLPPLPEPPSGRPLQDIAHDLRRLRPEARLPRPGVSMARQRGIVAAYDDNLLAACRALQIETDLEQPLDGLERGAERLRVEYLLEEAGLELGPPRAA